MGGGLRIRIDRGKIECADRRIVPAPRFRVLQDVFRGQDVLAILQDHLADRVRVGDHGDLIIGHPSGEPMFAVYGAQEPALPGIGDDVGPPGVDIAEPLHECAGQENALPRRPGPLGHQASQVPSDSAGGPFRAVLAGRAVVRTDGHAPLVDIAVGEQHAGHLRPEVGPGLRDLLKNPAVAERHRRAGRIRPSGDFVMIDDLRGPVILVVAHQDAAVGGGVLADHNREAGVARDGPGQEHEHESQCQNPPTFFDRTRCHDRRIQ